MNKLSLATAAALLAASAMQPALARDDKHLLPIQDVLDSADAQGKLGDDVKLHFSTQPQPAIAKTLGGDSSNAKTNAANKSDEEACRWAMLTALMKLQAKARTLGADAVVDIKSNYRNVPFESATEYECHAGAIMAGVSLRATYAKLK
ncbi:excinuclease ATPase subunit [Solimonas sp. K1W22B-7]|uniref:excinuclease ATPase subunit n=1 Tax=Solimonas sp. K1W22B-7 TaxID=2303331 RepID=UPI000E3302D8|nr:excinuclease ATPase subunit [Solimonas sp. K1W22B-7]AXQ29283.1 excinuclease ATPase subunit [Solimonas sp. K1W22B-7]